MSIRLAGLTRCGLPAVAASLLAVSSAVAEPMYTVADVVRSSETGHSSGDRSRDVAIPKPLNPDSSGKVAVGTGDQPQPNESKGPHPDTLKQGTPGGSAAATSRIGKQRGGSGLRHRPG